MERMGEFIYFQNFYFKPSFLRYRKFSFVELNFDRRYRLLPRIDRVHRFVSK